MMTRALQGFINLICQTQQAVDRFQCAIPARYDFLLQSTQLFWCGCQCLRCWLSNDVISIVPFNVAVSVLTVFYWHVYIAADNSNSVSFDLRLELSKSLFLF